VANGKRKISEGPETMIEREAYPVPGLQVKTENRTRDCSR
jgi:hypothetical protein